MNKEINTHSKSEHPESEKKEGAVHITIFVNARERHITEDEVTYTEVVLLAYDPMEENVIYTVSYKGGPKKKPAGTLSPGDIIEVKSGMIFNVTPTNKS